MVAIFWAILLLALIFLEASTAQFVSIWFAGGALCALFCAIFGAEIWVQIVVFFLVTVILLFSTKKIARKLKGSNIEKTNVDALIGQTGIVCEKISNINGQGSVKLGGMIWSARSESNEDIGVNEVVIIIKIDGVKLIVNKIQEV